MNRYLKLDIFYKAFNSFSLCVCQLTKVSTLRYRKVNRNIKLDCEKSSLAIQSEMVKLRINNLAKDIAKENQTFFE